MGKGIFIAGTDTDAGKTVVSAVILYLLRKKGINACYFKAALSGAIREGDELVPCDGRFVMSFAGVNERYSDIIPHIYERAVSPHLAGRLEGNSVRKEKVLEKYRELCERYEFVLVEGAGGIIVPLNDEGYMTEDLIKDMGLPVLLAGRAGVGTINHTSLSLFYGKEKGIDIKGVIMNGYNESNEAHVDNLSMIEKINGKDVIMKVPKFTGCDVEGLSFGDMVEKCNEIDTERLMEVLL